jgi:hypothetical protein
MTPKELARLVRNDLFATMPDFGDAIDYAYDIAKGTGNPAAVMTAVMVVVNTLAQEMEKTEVDKGRVDQ